MYEAYSIHIPLPMLLGTPSPEATPTSEDLPQNNPSKISLTISAIQFRLPFVLLLRHLQLEVSTKLLHFLVMFSNGRLHVHFQLVLRISFQHVDPILVIFHLLVPFVLSQFHKLIVSGILLFQLLQRRLQLFVFSLYIGQKRSVFGREAIGVVLHRFGQGGQFRVERGYLLIQFLLKSQLLLKRCILNFPPKPMVPEHHAPKGCRISKNLSGH